MIASLPAANLRPVTAHDRCPICDRDHYCTTDGPAASAVHCTRPDVPTPAGWDRGKTTTVGAMFFRAGTRRPSRIEQPPPPPASERTRANVDDLHKVYSRLLDRLTLSLDHRKLFRNRGWPIEKCGSLGYATLGRNRYSVVQSLFDDGLGDLVPRVPGLVWKAEKRRWSIFGRADAIMIPVRDTAARITSYRLRYDVENPKDRYRNCTSASNGGPSVASAVHVPIGTPAKCPIVRVTEGELKADLAFHLSGIPTISVPGVGSWRKCLPVLRALGAATVRLSFDADAGAKPDVAKAAQECFGRLLTEEFAAEFERWNIADGKGIDDLLAAGKSSEVLTGDAAEEAVLALVATKKASPRPTIRIEPEFKTVDTTMREITDQLVTAGNRFSRAGQLVQVHGGRITVVLEEGELIGHLNQICEVALVGAESDRYEPLPARYATTWLNRPDQFDLLPPLNLFTRNPVFTTGDWRLTAPGYDKVRGIYYAGPAVEPRPNTEHIDTLLSEFCFREEGDRTNYLGALLTIVTVPHFISGKPLVLLNGNQPELGKSILAQIIAILREGDVGRTLSYNPNDEEFEKTLGSHVRKGSTVLIIDNAKAGRRSPKIESPCLERCLTASILSFRLLTQSSIIEAENSHLFVLTANSRDVSADLITRSLMVNLFYEGSPRKRQFEIHSPEDYAKTHRLDLLGELIGMVERWKAAGRPTADVHDRFANSGWGRTIGGILEVAGRRGFLANAAVAAEELDGARREFAVLVELMANSSTGLWTASSLADFAENHKLLVQELGDGGPHSRATRFGTLASTFKDEKFSGFVGSENKKLTFEIEKGRKVKEYRVGIE